MRTLDEQPKIVAMANALGLHGGNRVEAIMDYCRQKVRRLFEHSGPITGIEDVERIISEEMGIETVEVWNDEDVAAVKERYGRQEKDPAFGFIERELTHDTFATLVRRKRQAGQTKDRYIAIIDCRGEKGQRRYFSRWHEIAHVLTMFEQLQLPLHRSTKEKDAVEQLMDLIAGDIGFFEPLFSPVLKASVAQEGTLTFSVVEKVRQQFAPSASLEATLNACANRLGTPVVLLQAALAFRKSDERAIRNGQKDLFSCDAPKPDLRAVQVTSNAPARQRAIYIPKNMRVPVSSVIFKAFEENTEHARLWNNEDLAWWSTSDGDCLRQLSLYVEAMRVRDRVWAILLPTERLMARAA